MNTLTVSQLKWFDQNKDNAPIIFKWASKGQVDAVPLMDLETGERSYGATCRGVRMSSCDDTDREEAIRKGKEYREKMLEETKDLPEIDERSLHIDGSCYSLAQKVYRGGTVFQNIFFLGQWCLNDGGETDALDEFIEHITEGGQVHESLAPLAKRIKEDEDDDKGMLRETFFDSCRCLGYYGFVVEVSVPVKDFFGDGSACSLSWSHYRSVYIYGDDLEQVAERAEVWAEEMEKKDKESSKKRREKKKEGSSRKL